MRGTVRKDGVSWGYLVYIGSDENGKKKYKRKRGFTTQQECETALATFIADMAKGTVIIDDKITVNDFMNYWLETYPKVHCQPSTYKRYKEFANDIKNYLGKYKLAKLNPLLVQKSYTDLMSERKLSNNTIIKIHRMFHLALKHAQKWQLININPCDLATPPPAEKTEMKSKDKALKLEKGIELGFVFHWEDGRPMDPHYVAQHFPGIFENHKNIPKIRFHDLRHTHATLLRKLKVDAKVISERLGHADVAFTLKTYTHVSTEMQRAEVSKAESYL